MSIVASTTLLQLGGSNRLSAMIGAHNFTSDKDGTLGFHFKSCKKANIVRIELNASDLYNIRFYKYNKKTLDCPEVHTLNDIYAEDLKRLIEEYTGLYLSL